MNYMTDKDRVIVEILSRSNKKELATLNHLLGKYCPYLPMLRPDYVWVPLRKDVDEDHKKILLLGRKYYGEKLEMVWRELTQERWKRKPYYHRLMPKATNRDNKGSHNIKSGGSNRSSIRYPSLKRSKATWRRFYLLFPYAERRVEV